MPKHYTLLTIFLMMLIASSVISTPAPPPNIRITNYPQLNNEEQVWFCPDDSNIVIADWRDFRLGYRQVGVGRSTDGGQTWTDSLINVSMEYFNSDSKQSDPTLSVDRFGNFYMCVLDYDGFGFTNGSIIAFYKSTDKGISWTGPYRAPNSSNFSPDLFEDKQFITVDRTGGTYDGNVYCSWTRFNNPDRIMFVRSTNGGTLFGDTVIVGPSQTSTGCGANVVDAGQFSIPVVNSNGDVHVLWQGFALDSSGFCSGTMTIKHAVSTDGGQTFSYEDTLTTVSGYMYANGGIDAYSQPVVDADITGGPFDGYLYNAFTNTGPEDDPNNMDVDFMRSTDNGVTWSDRIQINDYTNSALEDSFHPWLVVNQEGVICVIFYDERYDAPTYYLFDLMAAYSFDGGETFTTNHRISSVSSSPGSLKQSHIPQPWIENEDGTMTPTYVSPMGGLIGEYICISPYNDKMVAVWTDSRDGNSEVYTANWNLPMLEPRLLAPADSSEFADTTNIRFLWATSWKNNEDRYRIQVSQDMSFSSIYYEDVLDTNFTSQTFPDGNYYWRLKTFNTSETDSSEFSPVYTFTTFSPPCCTGIRGNVNGDVLDEIDISDLVYFVDYAFGSPSGPPPPCFEEADVDASLSLDIADIVYLVTYMFGSGPAPLPCP